MSKARMTLLPMPQHMSQTEVDAYLHKQVRLDAEGAGWLHSCVRKPGQKGSVFYATALVIEVSRRIAAGEYPTPKEGGKAA